VTAPPRIATRPLPRPAPLVIELPAPRPTPPPHDARTDRLLRWGLLAVAVAFVACYLAIAFARFRYPYQLEWLEGGVLQHVARVLHGQPLYGPPSLRFTPYIYTPLYYVFGAGASWVLGLHLSTLRLVSIGASLVSLGAIYRLVWLETRNRWAGVVAAGVFAATFRLSGAWFDLARVDTLFLALLLVGLLMVRRTTTVRLAVLAGLVLAAAFFAKQAALVPSLVVLPFLWRRDRRLALAYGGTLAGALAATTLVLDRASGGWFSQYTLRLPEQHSLMRSEFVGFWSQDLLRPLGAALLVGAVGLVAYRRGHAGRFWIPVTAGLLFAGYSARLHSGGYDNVLLPAYAGVALAAGLGLHTLTRLDRLHLPRAASRVVLLGLLVTLAALAYNPWRQLPSAAAAPNGDRLVADLARLPGPVYLPSQSWLLDPAHPGTPTNAQSAAIDDILRGHIRGSNRTLAQELRTAISERRFGSIVVDSPAVFSYLPKTTKHYYCEVASLPRRDRIWPVTGTRTAPMQIWAPRGPGVACRDEGLHWHLRLA
jgi:hypothetical protein